MKVKIDIVIFPEWSEAEEFKSVSYKQGLMKLISSNFFISEFTSLKIIL